MTRVTLDLDPALYESLRERAAREGTPVDTLVARLLAGVVKRDSGRSAGDLDWPAKDMGEPAMDISNNAAVMEFLDREWLEKLGYDAGHD